MRAPSPRFGRRRRCFAPAGRCGCAAGGWPCDCSARSGTGGHAGPARKGPSLTPTAMWNAASSFAPVAAPDPAPNVAPPHRDPCCGATAAARGCAKCRAVATRPVSTTGARAGLRCTRPTARAPLDVQVAWAARTCAKLARAPCDHLLSFSGCVQSGRGGIGRRAGFRFQWDSREGSSPFARTSARHLCQQGFPAPRALPGLYWRRNVEHHF